MLPGGVEHSAYCGPEGALVLDVFRPVREDYRTRWEAARERGEGGLMPLLRKRRTEELRAPAPFPPGWEVPARFNFTRDVDRGPRRRRPDARGR